MELFFSAILLILVVGAVTSVAIGINKSQKQQKKDKQIQEKFEERLFDPHFDPLKEIKNEKHDETTYSGSGNNLLD